MTKYSHAGANSQTNWTPFVPSGYAVPQKGQHEWSQRSTEHHVATIGAGEHQCMNNIPQYLSIITLGTENLAAIREFYARWGWHETEGSEERC